MATRTKSAKSKAVSKRKAKTTPTRKGKEASSRLPHTADGKCLTAEQIFAIDDADDDSSDWKKWSLAKCERERLRHPEIDAWLTEGDACLDRLIAKYDDIHDAAKTLSPNYERASGFRWRHRALAVLKATGFPPKDFNNLNIVDELETLQAAAAMKAEQQRDGELPEQPPKHDAAGPISCGDDGYSCAQLRELTGLSSTTLTNHQKDAKVDRPSQGEKNYRFPAEDVQTILNQIISNSSQQSIIEKCQTSLETM